MFDTEWNAHRIGILDNLFDWQQSHQNLLIILCTSKGTSMNWKFKNKYLTCLKHQINKTVEKQKCSVEVASSINNVSG